jgi:FkbM family methyltransferase
MNTFKELARRWIRKAGYDLVAYKPQHRGKNPLLDIKFFLDGAPSPVILDVGANVGQSILRFKAIAPDATIHSFEPSPTSFNQLQDNHRTMGWQGVHLWNQGVGAENTTQVLYENERSVMSSFLKPGELCTGTIVASTSAPVVSLDAFAAAQDIPFVHLLKSDTQGFEHEVFKGASTLLAEQRIAMVFFECIVSNQYEHTARLDTLLRILTDHGYLLVGFYNQKFQRNLLSWMDVLMVSARYRQALIT